MSTPAAAEPFNAMTFVADAKDAVRHLRAEWPTEADRYVPELLRQLAYEFEAEIRAWSSCSSCKRLASNNTTGDRKLWAALRLPLHTADCALATANNWPAEKPAW